MVISEKKDQESPMTVYHENSNARVLIPQPMLWYRLGTRPVLSKLQDEDRTGIGFTHNSAFQPFNTDKTGITPMVFTYNPVKEENTQVTWCCSAGVDYKTCSIAYTGVERRWDVHPREHWRSSLDDISRVSKEDDEEEGEIDVGDSYEPDTFPHTTSTQKYEGEDFRSDGGYTRMSESPVDARMKHITPEYRFKTVIEPPIKITSGSITELSTIQGAIQNTHSFSQKEKKIHTRNFYISENLGLQLPPNKISQDPTTDYIKNKDEPLWRRECGSLTSRSYNNGGECCIRSPILSPLNSKYLPDATATEDDFVIKRENKLVRERPCVVTEYDLKAPNSTPVKRSEDNDVHSSIAVSLVNDTSSFRTEDNLKQNIFNCNTERKLLRKTVLSPLVDVKDAIREHPTVKPPADVDSIGKRGSYPLASRLAGFSSTVIERNLLRETSTPVNVSENERPEWVESIKTELRCRRQYDHQFPIEKCSKVDDEQGLREQNNPPEHCSLVENHAQICDRQNFEDIGCSTQKSSPDENETAIDEEQHLGGRDFSPHKRSPMETNVNADYKQRLVDRHVSFHTVSPTEIHSHANEAKISEYRSDSPQKSSHTMSSIQIGDKQRPEDRYCFPQNNYLMGNHIQIGDKQGLQDRRSSSETHIKTDDKKCTENEIVPTERISQGNQTQNSNHRRIQGHAAHYNLNRNIQINAQQRLQDEYVVSQRSSVLVQARDSSPRGGQIVVQKVDSVDGRKVSTQVEELPLFSPEDIALRSRVLVLLWILLGESRLREVGYPLEPVHRILWRAVDVCCSVAGVKSAAAVPLNADHDCGSDMMCFRDHAHRFLEICAPTREHWKQFGWASLTVDAVVRKIYDEELVPLLRLRVLPPDIQQATTHLTQLDRTTLLQRNSSPQRSLEEDSTARKMQPTVIVPAKKKRGRPAKISHKVDEGGRIERVMLWRFLLNLLEDSRNSACIHWVQRDEGIFRILNTDWLARLWGRRHGNPRMTYEKMARAMRTYYRSRVLQPVPRLRNLPRKLVYKFNPAVIHKVAAMKLSCSTFTGRGLNYNSNKK